MTNLMAVFGSTTQNLNFSGKIAATHYSHEIQSTCYDMENSPTPGHRFTFSFHQLIFVFSQINFLYPYH